MDYFQIQINGLNTSLDQSGHYLHVVIIKGIMSLRENPTYLLNPSLDADFMKPSLISQQDHLGSENKWTNAQLLEKI